MVLGPAEAAPRLVATETVLLLTLVVTIIYSYNYLITWPRLVTVMSCVLMVTSSLVSQHYGASPPPPSSLTWADYSAACGPSGHATDQALCSHLSGLEVSWTGRLETVTHVSTTNIVEDVMSWLPLTLRTSTNLDCVLGDRVYNCEDKSMNNPIKKLLCIERQGPICGLAKWFVTSWRLQLDMHLTSTWLGDHSGGGKVQVVTSEHDQVAKLVPGTLLTVTGSLNIDKSLVTINSRYFDIITE